MARDNSPIVKQSRREGYALAPKAHKVMAKKSGIPGEHGDMRVRGGSLYLTQLREKQKVRRTYGLLEKQFAKLMREAQKADGLTGEKLLEFLEVDKADTIAFGDGYNDMEMLEFAGKGVAMGNAVEELKKIADYVTDSVEQDGIYRAMRCLDVI